MARTKQTAKRYRPVTTWTRFHLPLEQEWPTFPVADPALVHYGPLADVEGSGKVLLGRMVDDPEQAAYIIQWRDLSNLQKFQSSPACAEFLRNLPENNNPQVSSVESTSSTLRSLTIDDAPSSSSSPPPAPSRFLTLEEITHIPFAEVQGRVTFNAFLVPRKADPPTKRAWYESVRAVFGGFQPRGSEFIRGYGLWWQRYMTTWFWALEEDGWVDRKFGRLEEQAQDSEGMPGRTVIYEFHLWPSRYGATPEHEEASAANPQARESWNEAVAKVMPPVTAWVQERWDIRQVPWLEESEDEEQLEQDLGGGSED